MYANFSKEVGKYYIMIECARLHVQNISYIYDIIDFKYFIIQINYPQLSYAYKNFILRIKFDDSHHRQSHQ
jgi:hypothetical protein